jgi:hypothetical protein
MKAHTADPAYTWQTRQHSFRFRLALGLCSLYSVISSCADTRLLGPFLLASALLLYCIVSYRNLSDELQVQAIVWVDVVRIWSLELVDCTEDRSIY